jgi:hypothetical protein
MFSLPPTGGNGASITCPHIQFVAMDVPRVERGLVAAHGRLLEGYAQWGGHRFFGWTEYGEPRNHQGTVILSEGDCVHRLLWSWTSSSRSRCTASSS